MAARTERQREETSLIALATHKPEDISKVLRPVASRPVVRKWWGTKGDANA